MFCKECGNQVEQFARFCSKCGYEVTAPAPAQAAASQPLQPAAPKPRDMNMHINILAWLLIGSGVLTGIMALLILFASQIVHHLAIPWPPDAHFIGNPRVGAHLIGWIISVVGMAAAALAAGVTAAGVGLLQYRDWARTLAIIMAVFLLFHFPVGTAIAIYAFWVLFSREGQDYFKGRSAHSM